ncbi:hypothetical protein SpCBS45565_g08388 [Spizellomyces sp. 'palustris']|nr:hypothetical protein SpCBS45565_g08388 [Spizellomyces sp. 'palustris']
MTVTRINKILIANRAEIACRVIRTCKRLGIQTVAVYSDADANAPFVHLADEAVHIGASAASESYLCSDKIIAAALRTRCDAIHPGYGFLSESADFAHDVKKAGIIFIGPEPESISLIGDKSSAKQLLSAKAPSVALIPGYSGADQATDTLVREAVKIGFPVLLKASAGGGGKGMRVVHVKQKLVEEIEAARGEALRSFKDDKLLVERYIEEGRHVEVQIFGDRYGNVIHCFERECSVQRRHQKIIEETPSPFLDDSLRTKLVSSAITIGKLISYQGAGTVEFIVDARTRAFYFLEVNTRLQVEHPITEAITGLDLVKLQISVAAGVSLLDTKAKNLKMEGHAIECRLCAEDPRSDFMPSTGTVLRYQEGLLEGVRYDTGIQTGSEISIYYDPLLAKITAHAPTRSQALSLARHALHTTTLLGPKTNRGFLIRILSHPDFVQGAYTTRWLERVLIPLELKLSFVNERNEGSIVCTLFCWMIREHARIGMKFVKSGFRNVVYRRQRDVVGFDNGEDVEVQYEVVERRTFHVWLRNIEKGTKLPQLGDEIGGKPLVVVLGDAAFDDDGRGGTLTCTIDGLHRPYKIATKLDGDEKQIQIHSTSWADVLVLTRRDRLISGSSSRQDEERTHIARMPCRVLKVLASSGTVVKVGDPLLTVESMKMETKIHSGAEGIVEVMCKEGDLVNAGSVMVLVK